MHIRIMLEFFEKYKCPGIAFFIQSFRCVSNEQPCLKTGLDDDLLPSLFHFFYFIFSAPISFSFSSVQFSHSVVSNSLRPHEPQHARPPCLSPTSGVYSNTCPLSQSCHPTISSSVIPFSSCLQSFPASGSFQMSQFFASGGQSIGVSASASVLPMNIQN